MMRYTHFKYITVSSGYTQSLPAYICDYIFKDLVRDRLWVFFVKAFHKYQQKPYIPLWFFEGYVSIVPEILEILLTLSTESLNDQEKCQEVAERYYLLAVLCGDQWLREVVLKKTYRDLVVEIGQIMFRSGKLVDLSLVDKVLSYKSFDQLKLNLKSSLSLGILKIVRKYWF